MGMVHITVLDWRMPYWKEGDIYIWYFTYRVSENILKDRRQTGQQDKTAGLTKHSVRTVTPCLQGGWAHQIVLGEETLLFQRFQIGTCILIGWSTASEH